MTTNWIQDARHDGRSFGGDMVRLGTIVGLFYLGGHLAGLDQQAALETAVLIGGADWFNRPKTYKTVHDVKEKIKSRKSSNGDESMEYERDTTDRSR